MINQINEQIKSWLNDIVENIDISFCSPTNYHDKEQISIYLSSLEHMVGNTNPACTQIKLTYLVTFSCVSDERVHAIVSSLLMSGDGHPLFTIIPDILSDNYWRALKVIPQPLFSISCMLEIPRKQREAPLVKEEPNIVTTPTSHIYGIVLGDKNKPMSRCRLELKSHNRSVLTDHHGCFELGQVSSATPSIINVYTRSDNQNYSYVYDKFDGQEIIISLEKLEVNDA